ncbi:cysteine peptidase family C39 domain-containing protein [Fodinicola feengrottensis]|uniref:hypothetical protein n=1 Tax=Fodinicola feengrottensis TaxID=435914 RepID=UPI002441E252|nr:hypothetical protein [Fodinicola feengrottensis]
MAVLMGLCLSLFGASAASAFAITPAGVLSAAPAGATTLSYTWQGQQTYYYCGPGSTRMVLSARMSPPSQDTIAGWEGTTQQRDRRHGECRLGAQPFPQHWLVRAKSSQRPAHPGPA